MNESDKELIKASGSATADAIVAGIDTVLGGGPLATGAWGLSKALLGKGLVLRQKKAIEWVEMLRDNPGIFVKSVMETDEFQDTFVTCLESYIKERDYYKRILLQAIFKSYTVSKNPARYPVERLYEITKQITFHEAEVFSLIVADANDMKRGYSVKGPNADVEATFHLISLGLLIQDDAPRYTDNTSGIRTPHVYVSGLGAHYMNFIKSADTHPDRVSHTASPQ